LQDAGLSCFEYVEQLTLLLFLKMAGQLTEEPYNRIDAAELLLRRGSSAFIERIACSRSNAQIRLDIRVSPELV
jgi:hypothetical protein